MAEDLSINKNKIYSPRYSNNDICRLCLKNETHMEPLFYANLFPNLLLTKKIYDCTSIQIIYERNLPMYVCKLCANKLDDYMRFRERCIANDEFLRNALALFDAGNCLNIKSEDGEPPKPLVSLAHLPGQTCDGATALGAVPINLNVAMFPEKVEKMEAAEPEPEDDGIDGDGGGCEPDDEADGDRGRTVAEVRCGQCDFVGATEAALEEHDQCHRETNPYVCNVCTKSFKIRHHLLVHSHTHVESQPANGKQTYGCTKCTKVFVNKGNLLNHIESHLNEKSYTCEICSKSFKYNVQLRLHTRIHTGERPHKCEICSRGFSQLSNLRSHRKTHSKVKPYKCHLCLKSFTMLDNLTAHSLKCLKDKYRCNLCSKSFAKEGNLLSHLQSHSEGVVEKMFKCEMCPKSFKNKEDWKRHVRVHTGEKPYTCDICSKGFAQKANLLSHRKTHLKPNVIFKCEKCERTFKTQKVLDMHAQKCGAPVTPAESTPAPSPAPVTPPSVTPTLEALSDLLRYEIAMRAPVELQHMLLSHMEKKKLYGKSAGGRHYRCDVCFKGYSQYPSLIKHRKLHFKAPKAQKTTKAGSGGDSAESDDRPYYCDICGKNFKFNRNLKVHMKLHTKANYFKCDKCTNTFEQAEDLKNHLLTHPIDVEKIFNCEFCSNTFKSNEDLKRHRRSHTGERPFKCDTCSKAFTQLSNLRAHTKIHEKRRTYGCNICLMDFTTLEALNLHLKTHQLQLYELCRELKE